MRWVFIVETWYSAFGPYGPIFAAFGIYYVDAEQELREQHYTQRPMEDPVLSAQ